MSDAETNSSTFGVRLIEALQLQGFTDHKQQVEKVAQCLGVKCKTAEKYLLAAACPYFLNRRARLFIELAAALQVSVQWLFDGSGLDPREMRAVKAMESMTDWEKNQYLRLGIRLLNNNAKAYLRTNQAVDFWRRQPEETAQIRRVENAGNFANFAR